MGVKFAVIGAGSTYTPELVEGLGLRAQRLEIDEIALHDIDAERLEIVGGLAERILRKMNFEGRLVQTTDRAEAITGASFVLIQIRVGGLHARLRDETIPAAHGLVGQETTGAGGFAKALRTVPVVLDIAADTERLGAPGAWVLNFTNPAGLVTQALSDHDARAIGLCNIPIGFQRMFARQLGVDPASVQLEHVGLNHLSWERGVLVDGEDKLPHLIDVYADQLGEEIDLPGGLIKLLGALPSYYLRYFYLTQDVLDHQQTDKPRAQEVMEIEADLLKMYADPALDVKPKLLEQRGGAFYSEAAAMLAESLLLDNGDVQVVNVKNGGAIPNLAETDVVEVPCRISADGAVPQPQRPLPPEMLGLVQQVKAYERLTVEAATTGDRDTAVKALMANPLVANYRLAGTVVDEILAQNRTLLPRFFAKA